MRDRSFIALLYGTPKPGAFEAYVTEIVHKPCETPFDICVAHG